MTRIPGGINANAISMLRDAAKVLRRNNQGPLADPRTRALADILTHEARCAEADPDYTLRPETLPLIVAHNVLRDARAATDLRRDILAGRPTPATEARIDAVPPPRDRTDALVPGRPVTRR